MWDRSKTRCTACTAGCSLATLRQTRRMYYGTDRGERGRGAAAAGGLIIMIAVGRGDIAIAKHASKNDVNGHFINIQPQQYFAPIQSHYVKSVQTDRLLLYLVGYTGRHACKVIFPSRSSLFITKALSGRPQVVSLRGG